MVHDAKNLLKDDMVTTVLVAGGAGFLGSHLCIALVKRGLHVIALDDLSTGNLSNLSVVQNNPAFTFMKHDVIEPVDLKVDWIFNLASPASPPRYQADPVKTLKTNVIGSLNMLELAHKNNARILQASTSEVYGDPSVHPQPEEYWGMVNPIGIRSCYDEGKRCAETLFFDYHRVHGTDIKVVRIFNTYGPHMDGEDGRVVSNFIVRALAGRPLEVYGDGSQTRSFCYVDDLITGMLAMMDSSRDIVGPINIGNPSEFSVLDLAEVVRRLTKGKVPIVHQPLPPDDPRQRKPDIRKAKEILAWKPKVDLEEGLRKTIEYFSRRLASGADGDGILK